MLVEEGKVGGENASLRDGTGTYRLCHRKSEGIKFLKPDILHYECSFLVRATAEGSQSFQGNCCRAGQPNWKHWPRMYIFLVLSHLLQLK